MLQEVLLKSLMLPGGNICDPLCVKAAPSQPLSQTPSQSQILVSETIALSLFILVPDSLLQLILSHGLSVLL